MSEGEINDEIRQGDSISMQQNCESDGKIRGMEHEISIDFTEMLNQLPSDDRIPKSYISRVHSQLRAVNKDAYDPVLVSIGPYHYERRKSDLQYMETHKLRYLHDLMKRRKENAGISEADQLYQYGNILGELEDEARGYYEQGVALVKDDFIKMLLVDACFIIELLQRAASLTERETDPLFKAFWTFGGLQRDLILVENQIPFFVLERLYPIIGDSPYPLAFTYLAERNLLTYEPNIISDGKEFTIVKSIIDSGGTPFVKSPNLNRSKLEGFKHLLDLTRKCMLIGPKETTPIASANYGKTYSAIELHDLGVTFKCVENRKFYEIRFENGVLEIPVFYIEGGTETLFRNLIAYEEQGHCEGETIYVGNYMSFMDGLIDTAKDVELLRHHGIIKSLSGHDEEIAIIFNNTAKHRIIMSNYYAGIVQELTDHCKKRRHVWMAKLKRNYLSSPWKIISVIAAIVLLGLTIAQTVYSVVSYYKS